jgi:hypothetical protein
LGDRSQAVRVNHKFPPRKPQNADRPHDGQNRGVPHQATGRTRDNPANQRTFRELPNQRQRHYVHQSRSRRNRSHRPRRNDLNGPMEHMRRSEPTGRYNLLNQKVRNQVSLAKRGPIYTQRRRHCRL